MDASIVVVTLLCALNAVLGPGLAFDTKDIDTLMKSVYDCHKKDKVGLTAAVVRDGKVLYSKGFGVIDKDGKAPVTDETLFGIASISKSFAASLLVKLLYEKTNLTVDSKVSELLGARFKMPDEFRTKEATFADLMAHRMAVPSHNKIRFDTNLTRDSLIDRIHLLEAPFPFRVKFIYSNLMYGLVTRLAEIVEGDGQEWEELVHKYLYEPLGMSKSTFATRLDFSREDVAKGYGKTMDGNYVRVAPEFSRKWASLAGSGSVITCAKDMARWMNFHLYEGKSQSGQEVMDKDHLAEVHKTRFYVGGSSGKVAYRPQFPVSSIEENYAHGFRKGYYRGYKRLSHSGSTLGYKALMSLLPDEKIGVFTALTGRDDGYQLRVPLHMYLMDAALGYKPWLNASTICSYPEPWKKAKKPSPPPILDPDVVLKKPIKEYEGTYHNPAYGYLHIDIAQDPQTQKPYLALRYGWGKWRLYAQYSESSRADKFISMG